jgi:hypothetical protein
LRGSDASLDGAVCNFHSTFWARCDGIAARELGEETIDLLVDDGGELALVALIGSVHRNSGALGNATRVIEASVDGFLKHLNVPPVDKIAVEPVACRVSLGEDEGVLVAIPFSVKFASIVEDFKEDGDQMDGKLGWARTRISVFANRITHVRLVIGSVEVLAVPAGWEEDLSTKTSGALVVGDAVGFGLVRTKAGKGDCFRVKAPSKVAFKRVTGEHAEVLWESFEFLFFSGALSGIISI